ncbi:MAG: NAD(P)/FAD-dependent oxidoreductase, partial [Planctomycetes bacterium]|nr:NAD(P)/FAD-dependent oxidoreductase [Planctomycetota bacterium]
MSTEQGIDPEYGYFPLTLYWLNVSDGKMTRGDRAASVQVLVVGAGPAGLMAAVYAARCNADVTICEQLERPGLKLLATGGGRCNLTNTVSTEEFMKRLGRQGRFAQPALKAMDSTSLCAFLEDLGVPTCAADGFHIF